VKVAVTGGAGFIGSHVVDRLAGAGHEVVVVDVRPPHRGDVRFERADVLDLASLTRALRDAAVVFHLAGVANVNDAAADPVRTSELNVTGTSCVWRAARDAGVGRSVLASTVWVYGAAAGEGTVDESAVFDLAKAGHSYTASKLAAELVVRSCLELYGQEFTILRYGIPYGPRMREELAIPRFVAAALAGDPITVHGDGSQHRRYVYVEDLADAHVLAMRPEAANEVFNLEGPEAVTVRELVQAVTASIPSDTRVEFGSARPGDYAGREVSADHAARVLGWRPQVSFDAGLRKYIEWRRSTVEPVASPRDERRWLGRRDVAAACAVLILPALTVQGSAGGALGARTGAVLLAGTMAWLVGRLAPRTFPRWLAVVAAVVAIWLLSQAQSNGIGIASGLLGAAVGVCAAVSPTRWPRWRVAAAASLLLAAGSLGATSLTWWAAAGLVAFTTGLLQPTLRGIRRVSLADVAFAGAATAVTLAASVVVGTTAAGAQWFAAPIRHGDRRADDVALTIDTDNTAMAIAVANVLEAHNVKATFFVAGRQVRADPLVVSAILDRHQVLASASFDRRPLEAVDPRSKAIAEAQQVFRDVAQRCPAFLRPPGGLHTPLLARAAHSRGMVLVGWDVAVDGYEEVSATTMTQTLLAHVRPGSIVRIDLTRGGATSARRVVAAIPAILTGLEARGLEPVGLDELLGRSAYADRC
jgi:UDP-glucose 4-epimerase